MPQDKKFDPKGSGFDSKAAKKAGFQRDKAGHLPSILPIRRGLGRILKGAKHPTIRKTEEVESKLGNAIVKFGKDQFSVNLRKLTSKRPKKNKFRFSQRRIKLLGENPTE